MTISRIPSVEGGIQPTLLTAKGDLISATAASTVARLAVGSDAQILVADSTASTGLVYKSVGVVNGLTTTGDTIYSSSGTTQSRLGIGSTGQVLTVAGGVPTWATPSGAASSFSLISTTTLSSGSSASITGLSGYNQLFILVVGASSTAAEAYMRMRINGDTGSNYKNAGFYITNATGTTERSSTSDSLIYLNVMGTSAGETMSAGITINGANSSGVKTVFANGGNSTSGGGKTYVTSNVYIGTSVVSSFSIFMDAGTFDAGTIYTYGSTI